MLQSKSSWSRRSLLQAGARTAAAAGLANLLSPIARGAAAVEGVVVCVHLTGGNDSNNMVVPLDSYTDYVRGRGELAISDSALIRASGAVSGTRFGFHPALPGVRQLYQQGSLAVVANVGQIDAPHTKSQLIAEPNLLPQDLFQHSRNGQVRYVRGARMTVPWSTQDVPDAYIHGVTGTSLDGVPRSRTDVAMPGGPPPAGGFPDSPLGRSLGAVARILAQNGANHQAFLVTMPGFDTHVDELAPQAALFRDLDESLVAFYEATRALGIAPRVTTYTQTEFNRTLAPNQSHGTDHAWGSHALVMGGSVRGGDVYGRFPSLALAGPDDLDTRGVWIPSTSEVQYLATFATWFGVRRVEELPGFENLRNFTQPLLALLAG